MTKEKINEEELKKKLNSEAYHILREKGTERAFTGKYWNHKDKGSYNCMVCGSELFASDTKFDSGTGWPSFTDPANTKSIDLNEDNNHGMQRIEVTCKKCGSHLGHLFNDGPNGKKRFCINSACLLFKEKKT